MPFFPTCFWSFSLSLTTSKLIRTFQGMFLTKKYLFMHEKMTFLNVSKLRSNVAPCCILSLTTYHNHLQIHGSSFKVNAQISCFHALMSFSSIWGQYLKSYDQILVFVHEVRIEYMIKIHLDIVNQTISIMFSTCIITNVGSYRDSFCKKHYVLLHIDWSNFWNWSE